MFINGPSKQVIAPIVTDLRRRAAAAGRNPAEILIFTMMTVITAGTSEAARAKLEDYRSYVSEEGALVLMSGWTVLNGYGHYEVYEGEAFREVMAATTDWYARYIPARK